MKINSFLTLCAALAGGVAFASTSGQGYDASLVVDDTPATSFSDTVSGGRTGGQWSPDSSITREDSYYVFDDDSVTNMFAATTTTTSKYVQVVFDLKASPVAADPGAIAGDAQTAFCIYNNAFYGYGSGAWRTLTSSVVGVPEADADYKLRLTFDYHAANKYVRFEVATNGNDYAVLSATVDAVSTNWFVTASNATGVSSCAFAGCGSLKELQCLSYELVAESVVVPEVGNVAIPESETAAVAAAATTKGKTVAEVLAADASTIVSGAPADMKVADALALGLVTSNDDGTELVAKDNAIKMVPNALESDDGFTMNVNVAQPAGNNATIKYTLRGSRDGSSYEDVDGYTNQDAVPTVPTSLIGTESGKYLFFKVKVSVSYN